MNPEGAPSPAEGRRAGRRLAIDGLLRTQLGARRTDVSERALAALRVSCSPPPSDRIGTAQIRAVTVRARRQAPISSIHRRSRATVPAQRRAVWTQGAWAAATLAAVLVVLVFAAQSNNERDDAQVVAASGTVVYMRNGRLEPVRDAMSISRGDTVNVGVNSSLRVMWRDGTLLVCGAETRLRLEREGAGKRLALLAGRLDADVAEQPIDEPLRIVTEDAEVSVLGTRLSLSVREPNTRVSVDRGLVRVRRRQDGAVTEVSGGQQVVVNATGPLRSENTPVIANATSSTMGSGLFGQYFDDVEMTKPIFNRIDRDIYFNFGRDRSPDPRIEPSTFAIRWTGELQPKVSGRHVILCQVDDGVRVRIDGRLIMEDWRIYEPRWIRAEVDLDASRRHAIEVEYYQDKERTVIQLWWQAKGVPQEIIPTSHLFPVRPSGVADG